MSTFPFLKGLCSYLPGTRRILSPKRAVKDDPASYYYGVWLKHLTLLWKSGMREIPRSVVELGPGDAIGVGIAALLSGVEDYSGFDLMPFAKIRRNLSVFNELVRLFRDRAARPTRGWPDFDNLLDANRFPGHILTEEVLGRSLAPDRLEAIRDAILEDQNGRRGVVNVRYFASVIEPTQAPPGSADLVISHSVMEHVDDLEGAFRAFGMCLRPGGWMSHQIDLTCHELTREWNGHWAMPELVWKIVRGRRPYLINRQPCSRYLELVEKNGFRNQCILKLNQFDGIRPSRAAARWSSLSTDDLSCACLFIQARKRAPQPPVVPVG